VDELVGSEPKENLVPDFEGVEILINHQGKPESQGSSEPEEGNDNMARFAQAIEDYSNFNDRVLAVEILMNHVNRDDLDLMLQIIREKLDKDDQEAIIEDVKEYLDMEGKIEELQILEEHLERANLPFSALSEEDRKFVEECNPEGHESEVYSHLLDKLSEYLLGQDSGWEELFKHSVARQFKEWFTSEELPQINIDLEKLLQIELITALREREWTPEEKMPIR
jgi:hypothetical protein